VQVVVEGPVAGALGELARTRWQRALRNKRHPATKPPQKENAAKTDTPWPAYLEPALKNIDVAIARTEPAFEEYCEHFEIRNFYLDAIAAAKNMIFFENQYFSSNAIAQALRDRLIEPDGPDVILLAPHRESGWLEENTMGLLRARLYEQLKSNPHITRFYPYSPMLADGSSLNVHSKLMIVDDEWLTVGSANLSNRSMALDTECNLILDASAQQQAGDEVRAAIAHLRNRLLAEHLDCSVDEIVQLQQQGGLIAAIETLRRNSEDGHCRTLVPTDPPPITDSLLCADPMLIDPEIPLRPEHVIANYIPPKDRSSVRKHAAQIGIAVLFLGLLLRTRLYRKTAKSTFGAAVYIGAIRCRRIRFCARGFTHRGNRRGIRARPWFYLCDMRFIIKRRRDFLAGVQNRLGLVGKIAELTRTSLAITVAETRFSRSRDGTSNANCAVYRC
jgi:hypothetical protein